MIPFTTIAARAEHLTPRCFRSVLEFFRPWLRLGKRVVERTLHPFRRHRALSLVARLQPTRILIVCYGNICRSPYGAVALQKALHGHEGVQVFSAGLFGPGRPSPHTALSAAGRRGIDLSSHRSQLITVALLRDVDLVMVMEASQRRRLQADFGFDRGRTLLLGDFDPLSVHTRAVPDPYGGNRETFDECYARIDRCVGQVAEHLSRFLPSS
jgi:protein-tyrosine phosphatase